MLANPFSIAGMFAFALALTGLVFRRIISLGKSLGPVRIIEMESNPSDFWGYVAFYLILGILLIAFGLFAGA